MRKHVVKQKKAKKKKVDSSLQLLCNIFELETLLGLNDNLKV